MPGRRRVLFRRKGERRGISLPSRSAMISAWKSLSSREREERRRLVVEKYYRGDFSAFKKDAEKSPFKVLGLMFTVKPTEAVKPVAKKAEPKPKSEEKATPPAKAEPAKKLSEDESRRLYMLEKWLERLRKTGARDPRDPFKSLPPDHPLTVLQARKVEAQIRQLKGEITDEEYRRTVEKLNEEIKKVEKELESEKLKPEEKRPEAPAVEKTPEAKTKPEIGYFVFLSPEELKLLSDEELESYRKMMEERFWSHYKELDNEGAEKYRNEVDLILKEKGRRFVENARREILDVLAVDTSGMTLEELEDYRRRIDQIKRKYSFPPKELVEDVRKLVEKGDEVGRRIFELREAWKASLVEKARAGTLTYAETPDDNPFTLSWSSSPTEEERLEAQNWELLSPYVAAKERTKQVVEIMKGLGEEPDVEKIFQDYVEYCKSPPDGRTSEKDPYRRYWELNAKAHVLIPKVESLIVKRLVLAGDAQPSTIVEELPAEEREAARLAVVRLKDELGDVQGFKVKDFRTGRIKDLGELEPKDWIIPPEGWEVKGVWLEGFKTRYAEPVAGKALLALEGLVGRPDLYINVKGGRGYVEQMNGSHTTMFKGEIDLGDLDLEPGHYRVDLGWSKVALKNPHAIVKTGEKYLFMRFKDEDVDKSEVVFEKLKEPPEKAPELKVNFDGYVRTPVRSLKGLLKNASDFDLVRIEAKDGDIRIDRVARDGNVSTLKKDDIADKGAFDCTASQSKSQYSAAELKKLISQLSPNADITIRWAQDKPMKIEVEDEKTGISGEYWIAPYIAG